MTAGGIIPAATDETGTGSGSADGSGGAASGGLPWATPAAAATTVTTLNEQILLDDEAAAAGAHDDELAEAAPVPALGALAIALCTGVTVLFGVWPQPLIDFANRATLLFLPH
jgi:hypothetical protein